MIPGTFLGVVALAAALGPGYLYFQRAERHRTRPSQSQLGEFVEMVVVGGLMSLLAAGVILTAIDSTDWIATDELLEDPLAYLFAEPMCVFSAALAFYALAYGAAFTLASVVYRGSAAAIQPGVTGWAQAMWLNVPNKKETAVKVTVELKDGRRIAGGLGGFTPGSEGNREIVLVQPLKGTAKQGGQGQVMTDDFVVLHEDQIAIISGVYSQAP